MQKPKTDIYTIMLILSLIAIIVGCVLLYLEIKSYDGQVNGPTARISLPAEDGVALNRWELA
jgi:hypothetical protein